MGILQNIKKCFHLGTTRTHAVYIGLELHAFYILRRDFVVFFFSVSVRLVRQRKCSTRECVMFLPFLFCFMCVLCVCVISVSCRAVCSS